jgi:acyl CoA:acetate/3-ketoacid CoA transferase
MTYDIVYDPTLSGERRGPVPPEPPQPFSVRQAIARRAAEELRPGNAVNYGFGIPDAVAKLVARRGRVDDYYQTIEHGTYGGSLLDGTLFGFARNPSAMIDAPSQFDFYAGGGLDVAFLGFGEVDAAGHVNASKLGGMIVGPGGFMDIAQNARKVVFCGTFDARGAEYRTGDGALRIERHGEVRKLVATVQQITFSGTEAVRAGHEAVYVTERAVFRLTPEGMVLAEVAPGVDVRRDVLERMGFAPLVPREPAVMAAEHFTEGEEVAAWRHSSSR